MHVKQAGCQNVLRPNLGATTAKSPTPRPPLHFLHFEVTLPLVLLLLLLLLFTESLAKSAAVSGRTTA